MCVKNEKKLKFLHNCHCSGKTSEVVYYRSIWVCCLCIKVRDIQAAGYPGTLIVTDTTTGHHISEYRIIN
jgi:hypothetical protein